MQIRIVQINQGIKGRCDEMINSLCTNVDITYLEDRISYVRLIITKKI
jgi:hypothetical protein